MVYLPPPRTFVPSLAQGGVDRDIDIQSGGQFGGYGGGYGGGNLLAGQQELSLSGALNPNASDTLRSYQRSQAEIQAELNKRFPLSIGNPLMKASLERAVKGQQPYTLDDQLRAAQAAYTGESQIPQQESKGLSKLTDLLKPSFDNPIVSDIFEITSSIPKLVTGIPSELMQAPQGVQSAISDIGRGDIASALEQPGVRLLPGTFVGANLARGNYDVFLENPVFSTLDIAPAIAPMVPKAAGAVKNIPSVQRGITALEGTKPYQFFQGAFGRDVRQAMFAGNLENARIQEVASSASTLDPRGSRAVYLAQQTDDFFKRYPTIAGDENVRRRLFDVARTGNPEDIAKLPDVERAAIGEIRTINRDYERYMSDIEAGGILDVQGTPEFYDWNTYNRLRNTRSNIDKAKVGYQLREQIVSPEPIADPRGFTREAPLYFNDERFGFNTRLRFAEGYARTLEVHGYNAQPLLDGIKQVRNKEWGFDELVDEFNRYEPTAKPYWSMQQISDALDDTVTPGMPQRLINSKKKAGVIKQALQRGDYQYAITEMKKLQGYAGFKEVDLSPITDAIRSQRDHAKYVKKLQSYTPKAIERLERKAANQQFKALPARFVPAAQQEVQRLAQRDLAKYRNDPNFDEIQKYIEEGFYQMLPDSTPANIKKLLGNWKREAYDTVWKMRQKGFDPVFLHNVPDTKAHQINFPKVLPRVTNVSQLKERMLFAPPPVRDVQVALRHRAMEWLIKEGTDNYIDYILRNHAKVQPELIKQYFPAAEARAARTGKSVLEEAQSMMRDRWVAFDPNSFVNWPGTRLNIKPEQFYIPKPLHKALEKMQVPTEFNTFFDPVINAFRTSVLPLSPRWHLYNMIGGGTMASAEGGLGIWRYFGDAREIVSNIRKGIPETRLPDHMRLTLGHQADAMREWGYQSGKTMSRLFGESQAAKTTAPIRKGFNKVIQKSFDFNGFVDDIYRTMGYLYGHDRGVRGRLTKREAAFAEDVSKKMSIDEAEAAGLNLGRKIAQQWMELTPFERTTVRYILPFYTFIQHLLRYAFKYPLDHPWRASILANFAEAELEDFGTALPERFLNTFFLGNPDEAGNVTGINIAGMNPFSDVADYATLAGWLSQTNPVISTMLEQIGYDPRGRGLELFPDTVYDPISGSLKHNSPNPLTNFLFNTIPQSEYLATMMGASTELKELMEANPEAAQRQIMSLGGVPLLYRQYNYPEEVAKAEQIREEALRSAYNEFLRTDDATEINQYSALRPILSNINILRQSGQLTPLNAGDMLDSSEQLGPVLRPWEYGQQYGYGSMPQGWYGGTNQRRSVPAYPTSTGI